MQTARQKAREKTMAIYAVDFDNTLAVTRFPEIVGPKAMVVAAVKMLKANGHKIILWTSRAGKDLKDAVEWCTEQGIIFDAVNEPLPEQMERWGNDTRKVYASHCRSRWTDGGMTREKFMRIST